jgi:hypothetical protein
MDKKIMKLLNFFAWLTGVIVSLVVGFAMITKSLVIPYINPMVLVIAGYLVVITTAISIVLVFFKK